MDEYGPDIYYLSQQLPSYFGRNFGFSVISPDSAATLRECYRDQEGRLRDLKEWLEQLLEEFNL